MNVTTRSIRSLRLKITEGLSAAPGRRFYSAKSAPAASSASPEASPENPNPLPKSSCPPKTLMPGLAYLKDQPPVVALEDSEYPGWLWTILSPKTFPEDQQGPGSPADRARLRKENRERIKAQNFMKTQ